MRIESWISDGVGIRDDEGMRRKPCAVLNLVVEETSRGTAERCRL
jgi:hypothetical protein